VVNLLLWAILILRLYRRASEVLRWTFFVLLLLLLATGGSLAVHTLFPARIAVVVPQEVDAFTGPGDDAVVRFKLHAGSEVRVKDERDDWLRIALPDGQQGWIEHQYVDLVNL
jgi:SH3-like domain-containing protein